MVFVNKIDDAVKITAYLRLLLPSEDQDREEVLIQSFYSNYETSTYVDWMEDFQNGKTRILVCTDVVGMGVNIPNITRVI